EFHGFSGGRDHLRAEVGVLTYSQFGFECSLIRHYGVYVQLFETPLRDILHRTHQGSGTRAC
ncbi:MAG: hypothetical protein OXB95_04705, partial [Rhodobacteraceae bacterium]|nr:hypothetical protein [Paracoccaceae bacterium]